jgi:hypothetical protein
MPCDTRRQMQVDLAKSDPLTMMDALHEMKLNPVMRGELIYFGRGEVINTKTGKSTLAQSRNVNEIKQGYSRAVVRLSAKKAGWTVKAGAKQGELLMQRR